MGLVLTAATAGGQRAAAPAPESASRAGGHVGPAGLAGSPGWRRPGQGSPKSSGAGDFATLQPRRLHRRQLLPRRLRDPRSPSEFLRRQLGHSRLPGPEGSRREAGTNSEVSLEPRSLDVTIESLEKNRPREAGKQQAGMGGVGGEEW